MKYKTGFIQLLAAVILFTPLFSYGQGKYKSVEERKQMHNETPGDPYLPNAYENKKTSPAYRYKSSTALKTMGSTAITTIQVNVNASGQNILGDAANEPSLARNPLNGNHIVIGWRQFDNVTSNFRQAGWSYTTDAGLTWTFPGVIEPGIFRSDPVLDFDSSGNFYYNSLTNSPTYLCKVFESNDGGATWDFGTDAAGGDKQWMAIDRTAGPGSGNIYSFWTSNFSSCLPGFFTRSTDGGNSYENCIEVDGNPFWGTMAIGSSGELYIGGGYDGDSIVVVKSTNAPITGSTIAWDTVIVFMDGFISGNSFGVNPGGILGQVNIDVDRSNGPGQGNVYALISVVRTQTADPGDVMFARSTDGGITWDAPLRINDDPSVTNTQWFGTMSVAPNGRIDAAWLDTRDGAAGSDSSALYYSYSTDEGVNWSVNEKLSISFDPHLGYPNQNKMGDYFDMISDNNSAHLAWANTINEEQDVYYSRITPQITGVDETSHNTNFAILPNPNNGSFVIVSEAMQSHIEIYSVLGEEVYSAAIVNAVSEINISNQPSGIYFLKLVDKDGTTVVKKVIKE